MNIKGSSGIFIFFAFLAVGGLLVYLIDTPTTTNNNMLVRFSHLVEETDADKGQFLETNFYDFNDANTYHLDLTTDTNSFRLDISSGEYYNYAYYQNRLSRLIPANWDNFGVYADMNYGKHLASNNGFDDINMYKNTLYLRLDENTGYAQDYSENNYDANTEDGTLGSPTKNINGIIETAYDFNSTNINNGQVIRGYSPITGNQSFTMGGWYYPKSVYNTGVAGLISIGRYGIVGETAYIGRYYEKSLAYGFYGENYFLADKLNSNNWQHIVMTYDANNSKIKAYVNGKLIDSRTPTHTINISINNYTIGSICGATYTTEQSNKYYDNMKADEIFIFDRALTDKEIENIYKKQSVKFNLKAKTCDLNCEDVNYIQIGDVNMFDLNKQIYLSLDFNTRYDYILEIYQDGNVTPIVYEIQTNYLNSENAVIVNAHLLPGEDNTYKLGNSDYRWSEVWSANGFIKTSDLKTKYDISDFTDKKEQDQLEDIRVIKYKNKGSVDNRVHIGFDARDLKNQIPEAVVCDSDTNICGIDYTVVVPYLVTIIQEQEARLDKLEIHKTK